jgi:hypothetical protein
MLITYKTAVLTIEAMDGAMNEEHGFDWVNQIFEEKKKRFEQAETERKTADLEREKYEALIGDFWTRIKRAIYLAVEAYNSHIGSAPDRFRVETVGEDSLQVEKVTIPRATVCIKLTRAVQLLVCEYERPRLLSPHDLYSTTTEFDIRVVYSRLCLQDHSSGKQVTGDSDIAQWILAKFFQELQEGGFGCR